MAKEKLWGGRFHEGTAASVEAYTQSISYDWQPQTGDMVLTLPEKSPISLNLSQAQDGFQIQTRDFAAEQAPIQKLGENNVFFLPYLMGERSPHNDPDARAMFIGMSMDTTRADMTQAVLEGVAFGLRDSLEVARSLGIQIDRTKICGGGVKSPLWRKIIANVMNLKVDVIESEEGPALGGAMLAAVGCGEYPDVETIAEKLVKVVDTIEPEPELVAKYEERYQQFRKLYPAVKGLF